MCARCRQGVEAGLEAAARSGGSGKQAPEAAASSRGSGKLWRRRQALEAVASSGRGSKVWRALASCRGGSTLWSVSKP